MNYEGMNDTARGIGYAVEQIEKTLAILLERGGEAKTYATLDCLRSNLSNTMYQVASWTNYGEED